MQDSDENGSAKQSGIKKLSAGAGLLLAGLLLIHWLPLSATLTYAAVFVSTSLVFVWFAWILHSFQPSARFILFATVFSLLVHLSFLNLTPIGSDDVYRYMWDGKVQASGLNPYRYTPNDTAVDSLHSQLIPASVNHPDMKSVYFPLTQWVFLGAYSLSQESIWGYKLILLIAQIATIVGLFVLLKKLRIAPKYALLFALSPLPILQFGLDAHIDAVGLPLLIFGLVFYLDSKKALAYVLFALSISIKPVALLLLPLLFLREKGIREKAKVVVIPAIILVGQFLPYTVNANPFEALFTFASHWTFNGVVFETLNLYYGNNQTSRLICAALLVVSLLPLYRSKKDLLDVLYYSVILLLLFSPVVHPWYVAWLTVLLPFARRWSGIVYSASVSLSAYTIVQFKLYGNWEQSGLVLALEYLPVIILLILELRDSKNDTQPAGA
jgi:hypothetical protein